MLGVSKFQAVFRSQLLGNYHFPISYYNFYCKVVVAICEYRFCILLQFYLVSLLFDIYKCVLYEILIICFFSKNRSFPLLLLHKKSSQIFKMCGWTNYGSISHIALLKMWKYPPTSIPKEKRLLKSPLTYLLMLFD